MRSIITRVARLLHSPRASFSLFALLMVGTAAVALAPRATGGSGHMPTPLPVPQPVPVSNQDASGVTFTGVFSQTKLVQGGNGVVYLDLRIKAPTAAAAVAPQASDFIVVLDRSGSMAADNRLPYAKEAIRALLSRLHAEDRFALVTFDTTAAVHTALTPVTNQAREQIMRQVNLLRPGASTNLSDGLLQAQALLQAPVGERRRKVLLLSDGEANAGIVAPRELAKIAASFTQQQAVLSTIGMGLGFNETLMASLADYGMGHYGYLEHLEKLGDILQHDIHNTRQVFASASSLEITLGDGVTVTDVGGYPLDTTTQPGTVRVATGQLLGGAQKQFTVTFAMPTHHLGALALGPITLHYTTAQGQAHLALPREHLQLAVLESTRRDEAVASVDQGLLQKLWATNNLGRMQKEVSEWLRAGNKVKAEEAVQEYRQALQAAETATGVALDSTGVADKLSQIEADVKDAFAGPAAAQPEKRNRAAKSQHREAIKGQRAQ